MAFTHSVEGIGARRVTLGKSGTVTAGTHEGQIAAVVTGYKAKVAASADKIFGVISKIEDENVVVQDKGYAEVSYNGTAPTVGQYNNLEANGVGGVNVDAVGGDPFFVVEVDAGNSKCVIDLG